ncbi:hypothetical protein SDC9_102615 [bioreactor metagenome]|uniref:Uncharacterized protein n=1 Tax=bioreactor metagenome TaxID=1076179 RepID=A0A645AST5_9ZZZZ
MLGGGAHAVTAGFASNDQAFGARQFQQQSGVALGLRVVCVGHLGADRAVVLGPGIHALEDVLRRARPCLLPGGAGGQHVGMNAVAPTADFAVHGPHHQGVAALRFQRVEVGEHALAGLRIARCIGAVAHLLCRYGREGRYVCAIAGAPEAGVRNVITLVGVERERDVIDARVAGVDEARQTLHVSVRSGHGQAGGDALAADRCEAMPVARQVAEVVLWIDQKQLVADSESVLVHGRHPPLSCVHGDSLCVLI